MEELSCDTCQTQLPCFTTSCTSDLQCELVPMDDGCGTNGMCSAEGLCIERACESSAFPWVVGIEVTGLSEHEGRPSYLLLSEQGVRTGIRAATVTSGLARFDIEGLRFGDYDMLLFLDSDDDLLCQADVDDVFDLGRFEYANAGTTLNVHAAVDAPSGCEQFPYPGDNARGGACGSGTTDGCVNLLDLSCTSSKMGACGFGLPQDVNFDGFVDEADTVVLQTQYGKGTCE